MEIQGSRKAEANDPASAEGLLAADSRTGARAGVSRCRTGEEGQATDKACSSNWLGSRFGGVREPQIELARVSMQVRRVGSHRQCCKTRRSHDANTTICVAPACVRGARPHPGDAGQG